MSATEYESSTDEDITLFETEAAKPKPAKKKKPMSEARRKQLLENLKKGRETSKLKRQQKANRSASHAKDHFSGNFRVSYIGS